MKILDIILEKVVMANPHASYPTKMKFPDGEVWLSQHFKDRIEQRDGTFDRTVVVAMIRDAAIKYGQQWAEMDPVTFVIKQKNSGLGVSISKMLMPDDSHRYIIKTVHATLKLYPHQPVFTV